MRQERFSVSGISSNTGFELTVVNCTDNTRRTFQTKFFSESSPRHVDANWFFAIFIGVCMAVFTTAVMEHTLINTLLAVVFLMGNGIAYFLFLVYAYILNPLIYSTVLKRKLWLWHSAEHKAAEMIERNLMPTKEVMKRLPKTQSLCGTSLVCGPVFTFSWMCGFAGFLLLKPNMFGYFLNPVAVAGLAIGVLTAIDFCCWRFIGKAFQKLGTTREPNDEQIEEALELVTQVYREFGYNPEKT